MITLEEKENKFRDIVAKEAEKRGCVFFEDVGNGKEIRNENICAWDMFGWLIPKKMEEAFGKVFGTQKTADWDKFLVSEEFNIREDGEIEVKFIELPDFE